MAPACRPGTAAAAAVVIAVAVGLALRGIARTPVASAGAVTSDAPLIGPRVRAWYRRTMAPLEALLVRWGVSADALTFAQLGVSVVAGLAFGRGAIFLAGWFTLFAGTLDILDGGVARASSGSSARGALMDSVVDRWSEGATFFGLGVFFREQWVVVAVVVAAFASMMVSYVRARAEGLGVTLTQGRAQRPERYVVLGFGAWMSGLLAHVGCETRPSHVTLAMAVCVLAALAMWTAVQRTRQAARALIAKGGR